MNMIQLLESVTVTLGTVIFDIDGTLSDPAHRRHFLTPTDGGPPDWDSFYAGVRADPPIPAVIMALHGAVAMGYAIALVSGRRDSVMQDTIDWIDEHVIETYPERAAMDLRLRMREHDDHRPDHIVKEEWLLAGELGPIDQIVAVYDDRSSVVQMWRSHGLPTFQVAEGNF